MYRAKHIKNWVFATSFVNSKFDNLKKKVQRVSTFFLWQIKGWLWFIFFHGLTKLEQKKILRKVFNETWKSHYFRGIFR